MAVSESFVREFFELHGFLVHQRRKYLAPAARDDEEIDFLVQNPQPAVVEAPLPFVLASDDLARLDRAIVVVKGGYTETFSQALLTSKAEFFRFVEPGTLRQAVRFFGGTNRLTKVLIVPSLPQTAAERHKSIELLCSKGVEAVILFRTLLGDLVAGTEPNRNYQKSDLLQTIRIFKHYEFFREPQMELFKPRRSRLRRVAGKSLPAPEAS